MREVSTPEQEERVGLKFLYRHGADPGSPLVILVHGRAGTRDVMWTFERSIPAHAAVVSFEAFLPDPIGGFSWWSIESAESVPDATSRAAARLASALASFEALYSLKPSKRIALGFSQGAALLSASVLSGKISLSAVGLLAGFVVEPETVALAGRPRVFVGHGTLDDVIRVERARKGVERLRMLGLDVVYVEDEVGHKVGIQGTRALKTWLAAVA